MLPSYYQHVNRYENSLVTKFYGVHCVKPIGGQKTRFIVMGNMFCSECDKMGLSPFLLRTGKEDSYQNEKFMRGCRFLEAELQDMDRILAGQKPLIRLGANMPARAVRMEEFSLKTGNIMRRRQTDCNIVESHGGGSFLSKSESVNLWRARQMPVAEF
ncbi:hypothetical protein V6N13_129878 [Hibiscus sabdariffa]